MWVVGHTPVSAMSHPLALDATDLSMRWIGLRCRYNVRVGVRVTPSTSLVACPEAPSHTNVPEDRTDPRLQLHLRGPSTQRSLLAALFQTLRPDRAVFVSIPPQAQVLPHTDGQAPPPPPPSFPQWSDTAFGSDQKRSRCYDGMAVYSQEAHAVYNLIPCLFTLLIFIGRLNVVRIVFLVLSGQLIRFSLHTDVVKH